MVKKYLMIPTAAISLITALFSSVITVNAKSYIDDRMQRVYNLSPYAVRQGFEKSQWDIEVIGDQQLNYSYGDGNEGDDLTLAGVTVYEISTIYLSDQGTLAENALNHEMGHFFDYSYYQLTGVLPSQTNQFSFIYTQEGVESEIYEPYTVSSQAEYFAQSYKYYCEDKEDLGLFYPQTYAYINDLVSDYEGLMKRGCEPVFYDIEQVKTTPDEQINSWPVNYTADNSEKRISFRNEGILQSSIVSEQSQTTVPYEESKRKITIIYN